MNTDPRFDTMIDRRGTDCAKWDAMEKLFGVPADDGLAMWVADMDFKAPPAVLYALREQIDHGVFGYYGAQTSYLEAIQWWMKTRHNWEIDAGAIFTTHGLVNGTAMCLDAFSEPGDGIVVCTPVYHAFMRVIRAAGREVVECEMVNNNGRYELDFDAWDAQMTGTEKMLIWCSPHNPGGRVWTRAELEGIAAFAKRHDLILVSDEIHHDLVMPGHTHIPMAHIAEARDRLVMMTSTNKTFNLSGNHTGNVIVEDEGLRARFAARMGAINISPNSFGLVMTRAAYSVEGADWLEGLNAYLDENRKLFDAGIAEIPGLSSMPLESTYLAWVDFSGTGMTREEFTDRVEKTARIAANHGTDFGKGGETFLRFNFATQRANVQEAVSRLQDAFSDLQ